MQTMNFTAIPTPRGPEEKGDLGFGAVVSTASSRRLLNPDGTFNARRVGLPWSEAVSLYHSALTARWPEFFLWVIVIFVGINVTFGIAFALCGPAGLSGPGTDMMGGTLVRAFFFSVETFATIGYGNLAPQSVPAHVIMTVEAFVGILAQALITGLFFARFARPTAAITFSRHAVVAPFQGGRALMIRMANRRKAELIELSATLSFSFVETVGNQSMRRYRPLTLERSKVTFFPLTWTLVHPITPESPLWGLSPQQLAERDAEFLLLLSGTDDTFASTVHARTSYKADQVRWDHRFTNIFVPPDEDGILAVDVSRLDEATPA
ncbi:MAG: ion channel [Gemmatimonadota bacterium]|nr:ion channel [Gemmatimonadota bacterium]